MHRLTLTGLDGSNPLAFLAALGTLQALDDAWFAEGVRLAWEKTHGAWRPELVIPQAVSRDAVLAALMQALCGPDAHAPFSFAKNLNVAPKVFREFAGTQHRAAEPGRRRGADFAAAFGCDATSEGDAIQDTAFRTMSGAGHQHFLAFMRELVTQTSRAHLEAALFEPWAYADPGPSLRWDPVDDRRYAMRWREPSGDPIRTVRGANRLAIEGLRLYPAVPRGARLATTGFTGTTSRDTYWTWPIWSGALPVDVVRSVVGLGELQTPRVRREDLTRRGIAEVYRSQRFTVGKYRNFSPARPA